MIIPIETMSVTLNGHVVLGRKCRRSNMIIPA